MPPEPTPGELLAVREQAIRGAVRFLRAFYKPEMEGRVGGPRHILAAAANVLERELGGLPPPMLTVIAPPTPMLDARVQEWAEYLAEFHDDVVVQYNDRVFRIGTGLTPAWLVEKVRRVLGGIIHMDPASSPEANARIRAEVIYTREDNGLTKPWRGPLFVSPPGGKRGLTQSEWWLKLIREWASAWHTPDEWSAVFLGFESSNWQTLELVQSPVLCSRTLTVSFDARPGVPSEAVTNAILILLSTNADVRARFAEEFP